MGDDMNPAIEGRSAEILARTPPGGVVVELGVWNGRLSRVLLERSTMVLHMVDTWAAMADRPDTYTATDDPVARSSDAEMQEAQAAASELPLRYPGRAIIHQHDTAEAADLFADESVDVVFIDADHSERGCARDIEAWTSKVRPGGWLGGHDYGHPGVPGVAIAVNRAFSSNVTIGKDRTWWVQR